jgi:hypothetical protein
MNASRTEKEQQEYDAAVGNLAGLIRKENSHLSEAQAKIVAHKEIQVLALKAFLNSPVGADFAGKVFKPQIAAMIGPIICGSLGFKDLSHIPCFDGIDIPGSDVLSPKIVKEL